MNEDRLAQSISVPDGDAPKSWPVLRFFLQAAFALIFVAAGIGIVLFLRARKEPPAKKEVSAVIREVRVSTVNPENRAVVVTGHGTVRAKYRVALKAQVGGKVVRVSPRLKAGHRVPRGTVLIEIERDNYDNALAAATADENRLSAQVRLLEENLKFDRRRLELVKRSRDLARNEFDRVRDLLQKDRVGSETVVENVERQFLERENQVVQLENSIANQPIRVAELQAALNGARARRAQARLDLDRTKITAPFDARVEESEVQIGDVVNPSGQGASGLAVLTDLSVLEIPVAIDNDELAWLPIRSVSPQGEYEFDPEATVSIQWMARSERARWKGRISRLERFESATRTITLVIELVDNRPGLPADGRPQLAEGMFCQVTVTGVTAREVISVPRSLIRQDGTVPVLRDGRLELPSVHVLRFEGDAAFIDRGIEPGSRIVLTPIANPVPGMALTVVNGSESSPAAGPAMGSASTPTAVPPARDAVAEDSRP